MTYRLVERVIEELRAKVTSGEWPVGGRIPTEPQLVEALGVGRNTIREAVKALVHAGVLETRQGSGTYVMSSDELAGVVGRRMADAEFAEVVEVRRAFEVEAARLAAVRRTPTDVADLERALDRREAAWAAGRLLEFVEADVALHAAILAAAHNEMLAGLYASFRSAMRATVARSFQDEGMTAESYVDHGRLVAAIRAGDAELAAKEAGAYLE
ncbi:DNA-binding FadR family transcriptional regulator [Catenuloplanes nepalensis]|uniref:DNA-binding FadR family transcriptional regulator n=1 Tax=Catenuloplanes nepalensis TaxID=587533 RepID=A0ABT9N512_9ACTN|nr:FCD domain-containing protein [Catenuloplanes nepalensis]MDP9798794.1 DNA-binding FadR family transcriptional regulator [Catenuloplanes nepalensis]